MPERLAALAIILAMARAGGTKEPGAGASEFLEMSSESMATARAKAKTFAHAMARLRGDWWEDYKKDAPPEYLQPPWASAPSMSKVTLPEAPKPMAPPPAPEQGFQGAGKFYPPPPAPPPSPPPPLPPPPPAPAASYHAYHPPASSSPIITSPAAGGASFKSTGASLSPPGAPAAPAAAVGAGAGAQAPPPTLEPRFKSRGAQLLVSRARKSAAKRKGGSDDSVEDAMFAPPPAPAADAKPAAAPSSAVGARFSEAGAKVQAQAAAGAGGGAGGGEMQWQYYDPNSPPSWLMPGWNSAPRTHVAAPAVTSLNAATPMPNPANPSSQYWNGYTPSLLEVAAAQQQQQGRKQPSAYAGKRPVAPSPLQHAQ